MGESDPVVHIDETRRRAGAPTSGMRRQEAVATDSTWGGLVHTDPGMVSGWHHHGDYESVIYVITGRLRMESGPGGTNVSEGGPGDFLFVPRGSVHRESNPSDVEATAVVVRSGRGEPLVNVEGPAYRWDDPRVRRGSFSLVLALTLLFFGCSSAHTPPREPAPAPEPQPELEPESTESPQPAAELAQKHERILPEHGDFVAVPRTRYTPMWEKVGQGGAPDFTFDTQNPMGQLAPLLIDGAIRRDGVEWLEVLLPLRPNGTSAWVKVEDVEIREREERIEVDLSRRVLRHYEGDEIANSFRVGVGSERYPTGVGRFYIWVKVPYENPNNPYGIMALGLSGFSPVLSDWPGQGRMAVHGTPHASNRGQAVSHGCVRVYNHDMQALLDLPLGTPVEISR